MAREDLIVQIGASLAPLRRSLDQAAKDMKRFSYRAESIGRDLTASVSLPIAAVGVASVKTFAAFDRMEKGLAALNGSVAEGKAQFERLNKIVLDTRTTLDLKTAALGAQRLQGAGLSAQFAEQTIRQLGIAATVSGSQLDDVGGVMRQFTQIIGKGKIEQEDLNTILDRMPALGAVIKQEFGASTAEGIRETGISMEEFVARLVTAIQKNEDFQGVQGGLAKAFESFSNAVQTGIRPLGESIAKAIDLEGVLAKLSAKITSAAEAFSNLSPRTQKFIVYTAGAAAATGPLIFGLGTAARALVSFRSAFAILSGPIVTVTKVLATAATRFSGFANLLLRGGAIGRSLALAKVLGSLRTAFVAITGPVGIAIAAVTGLIGGFKAAYSNSSFFRDQLDRVSVALTPVKDAISQLASKILPNLSAKFNSLKKVTDTVFAGIGAIISVAIESLLLFIEQVKLGIGIAQDLGNLNFSAAGEKLSQTLLNPQVAAQAAKRFAGAFTTTFNDIINKKPPQVDVDTDITPSGGDSPDSALQYTPSVNPVLPSPEIVKALPDGIKEVITLSDHAREVIAKTFNFDPGAALKSKFDELGTSLQVVSTAGNGVADSVKQFARISEEIANEEFAVLQERFDQINLKSAAFGTSFDANQAKITAVRESMLGLLNEGISPMDEAYQGFLVTLNQLTEAQEKFNKANELTIERADQVKTGFETAFDAVGKAVQEGGNAFKAFAQAALGSIAKVIKAKIQEAVVIQATKALQSVPFPFNIAIAAGAGAAVSGLMTAALSKIGIPALAKGGLVDRPTLALIGEAGPEAVVPLDRMEEFRGTARGGGAVEVFGRFELQGDRLIALIDRSRPAYNRSF